MELVYICSPYREYEGHTVEQNLQEAREFCRMMIEHDEVPICPHLYLPQFLLDDLSVDREKALNLCTKILTYCSKIYVFPGANDYISEGMAIEKRFAEGVGMPIVTVPDVHWRRGRFQNYKYKNAIDTLSELKKSIFDSGYSIDVIRAEALDVAIKVLKEAK